MKRSDGHDKGKAGSQVSLIAIMEPPMIGVMEPV